MSRVAFERAFQELTDQELDDLMAAMTPFVFPAGTRVLREGESNQRIYVILDGVIRVIHYERDGTEKDIALPLGPGDVIGEMSYIDGMGASATLIADSPVLAHAADHRIIEALAERHPHLLQHLYHSLLFTVIRRLRRLDAALLMPDP